ncbi:ABC transporter ATP-binding protein [Bacillaceae bacterium Marseille-Q3522]|nr:ABC transporter ATP-binding protein [Bacillaceae bacterium Marseille-Q3522]
MYAIETNHLEKSYGKVKVIKGIDLRVKKGELFGFLGRNGAGKSTFINMLTGIIRPSAGTFSLLGVSGSDDEVKKKIGVMPDYSNFYSSLSAIEHLKYFAAISGKKVSKERAIEVLKLVGLETHARKKAGKFSFGMKKKLGIAQAIIHEPELIFLDEPTSGLDAESAIHIQHLIASLQESGKTIFMTSHNLNEVEKICTNIAIMQEGKITKSGTMEELRSYYQSAITVKLKHSQIPRASQLKLMQWLQANGTNLTNTEQYTSIQVENEKKIAAIVRAFDECKTDIYRVEVEEPSLEEIFLEQPEMESTLPYEKTV